MRPLLALFVVLLPGILWAQDSPETRTVRLEATQQAYVLDAALDILKDPDHRLGIAEVTSPEYAVSFHTNRGGTLNFGYSNANYWVRFTLQNGMPERRWFLEVANPNLSKVTLYVADTSGVYQEIQAGTSWPYVERPIQHRSFLFPFAPAQDTQTYYLKIFSEEPVRFSVKVWEADTFYAQDSPHQLAAGFFYGILAIMLIYNLVLFFSIKDRGYLFFVLFIVPMGLLHLVSDGFAFAYLWPNAPDWNQESRGLLNGLANLWGILFARHFLDTERMVPRLDVLLQCIVVMDALLVLLKLFVLFEDTSYWGQAHSFLVLGLVVVGILLFFHQRARFAERFSYSRVAYLIVPLLFIGILVALAVFAEDEVGTFDRIINTIVSLGTSLLVAGAGIVGWMQGQRHIRLFVLGISGFLIGGIISVLMHVGVAPFNMVTAYSEKVGVVVGMVLLSLSLGDRFSTLKKRTATAEATLLQAQRQTAEARFEALQAKINPHFLFNTLNAIASLIRLAPVKAERAVEQLSRLFRYTLRHAGKGLVLLSEELHMVRAYLDLEALRFDERLSYTIHTSGDLEQAMIPALLVQPLVENSVKYAISPRNEGGSIAIYADVEEGSCRILVKDNGPGWQDSPSESGHGLNNIRERLYLAFGDDSEVHIREHDGVEVELRFPLQTLQPVSHS